MENIYTKEDAKKALIARLEEAEKELKNLSGIEYATKKDGKPFCSIKSNFKNVSLGRVEYSFSNAGAVIWFHLYGGTYEGGYFNITVYTEGEDREKEFTFDVAKRSIDKQIARLTERVADYKKQLAEFVKAFAKVDSLLGKIKEELKGHGDSLRYILAGYVSSKIL